MLLVSLAFAGILTPAAEPGAWTEVIRSVGLDPGANVIFEVVDQGYRVRVATSGGERVGVVTGPHAATTREDAARLARSLLVTQADPLDALLPAVPPPIVVPPPTVVPPPPRTRVLPPVPADVPAMPPLMPVAEVAPEPIPAPLEPMVGPTDVALVPAPAEAPPTGDELHKLENEDLPPEAPGARRGWFAPAADAPPTASVAPRATRVFVGVGARDEVGVGEAFDGIAIAGRYRTTDTVGIEANLYVHLADESTTVAPYTAALEVVADLGRGGSFQQPVTYDRLGFDVLVDWSVVPQRGVWSGGPHLQAGAGLRLRQDLVGTVDAGEVTFTSSVGRLVPALDIGVSMEGWFRERLGLRARAVERVSVEPEPDYGDGGGMDNQITPSLSLGLDLMVHL